MIWFSFGSIFQSQKNSSHADERRCLWVQTRVKEKGTEKRALFKNQAIHPRATFHRTCLRAACSCLGSEQSAGASDSGTVICWLCIWTCWHRVALCWGCSSRPPQGSSCNAATLTCWRRAGAQRTRWKGPLNGRNESQSKLLYMLFLVVNDFLAKSLDNA